MDAQVIVVGAGPVGLLLAGELRLGGVETVVLDRLAAPTDESRASTLHARTMEIFEQRGLLDALGSPPNDPRGHFGGLPLDLGGLATPYPGQWKVPQTVTERVLGAWAAGLGADVRRSRRVRRVVPGGDRVAVEVEGPAGPERLTAAYVVGCDGEGSTVRTSAGIAFSGTDEEKWLLRADVAGIDVPDRRFQRLDRGMAVAARRPDGVTRVMVHEFGAPAAPGGRSPDFAAVAAAWKRVTGEDVAAGEPLWVNAFGDVSRQAERYRHGRVLVAGDAAHAQMPVGGQALNLGLQDAFNLGWKLAAEVRGDAPAGLLDSYHGERHPVGERVLSNIRAQTRVLLGGPEMEGVRALFGELLALPSARTRLASAITGLDVRYGADDDERVGTRLEPAPLDTDDGPTSTAALLRPGRGVLLDLSGRAAAAWAKWNDRVDVVTAAARADGPLAGLGAVLLRPDGHVAWAAPADAAGADPRPALRRWFGDRGDG
ncbi:FAD-dependent monooxygenase [Actinomadura atramentaria]|uniref:FAD-dependent monooxygenase n=1 Tax=Actinomadura atramentaria TaxID=1990 RepID=UPI00038274B2|nr:FAD-dependent monooxygenase [Actinomadura atramentaria]